MKKLLISAVLLAASVPALAQWHHRHHDHRGPVYYGGTNWVAPLIIGGVVGAAIANRSVQAETVIVQPPQSVIIQRQPICTEWKEIQHPDGQIYRERTCTQ